MFKLFFFAKFFFAPAELAHGFHPGPAPMSRTLSHFWPFFGARTADGSVEAPLTASARMTNFGAQIIHGRVQ